MRKVLSFGLLYLYAIMINVTTAQEETWNTYNKWSIEPEVGAVKVRDITSVRPFNADLGVRYMANTKFGVKLSGNYTRIYEQWDFAGEEYPINYLSGTIMGVVNIGRVLEFESFTDWYTILGGVGGNYSHSERPTNDQILFRTSNFHLAAFVDNEFKVSDRVFLRVGMDVITGVNLERNVPNPISETTSILNFNIGATISLGKSKYEHADWFIQEPDLDIVQLEPTIIDKTVTNEITKYVTNDCDCDIQRYLYFAHDSYELTQDTREAIEYTKDKILKGKSVTLKAYCSNVGSIEYNKALAWKRAMAVHDALIGIGVLKENISIEAVGIDDTRDENVYGFGRRVELITK